MGSPPTASSQAVACRWLHARGARTHPHSAFARGPSHKIEIGTVMTSVSLRLASFVGQGRQRSVVAEPAVLDVAAHDAASYSIRACSCGSAMFSIPAKTSEGACWQCPACGTRKRR